MRSLGLAKALSLQGPELICFIGAGGKSSLLLSLAGELAKRSRVLLTTTTKMYLCQLQGQGEPLIGENYLDMLQRLAGMLSQTGLVSTAAAIYKEDKVAGHSPEFIDLLYGTRTFDYILVEADGAKGRPFKMPKAGEPVLPRSCTTVLPVVGIDILGKPLKEDNVHRHQLLAKYTGQELGSKVTVDTIRTVLKYYYNLAREQAENCRFMPIVNKADTTEELHRAQDLAQQLLGLEMPLILVASTKYENPVRAVVN